MLTCKVFTISLNLQGGEFAGEVEVKLLCMPAKLGDFDEGVALVDWLKESATFADGLVEVQVIDEGLSFVFIAGY